MATKARATAIGIFVLAGCCLAIFLIVAFGGQRFFVSEVEYRVFFDKSVKGLSIGSPVMFRGVRIGQVSRISLSYQTSVGESRREGWPIEVTISLSPQAMGMKTRWTDSLPEAIRNRLLTENSHGKLRLLLEYLVEKEGMRAQLQSLSLLTGQLFIEMNFFPHTPFTAEMHQDLQNEILPVQMSAFERLFLSLGSRDFSSHLETFYLAMEDLSEFVDSGKFRRLLTDFSQASKSLNSLIAGGKQGLQPLMMQASGTLVRLESVLNKLDAAVEPVQEDLQNTMQRVTIRTEEIADQLADLSAISRQLLEQLTQILTDTEPQITELLEGLNENSAQLQLTMQETQTLLQATRENLGTDSPMQGKLNEMLNELHHAALALRNLAEYLRRNPEALLRGKNYP